MLVLEDEYFLATEIERELDKEGAVIFGPFASLEDVQESTLDAVDAAILNVRVRDGLSYPLAAKLRTRGIPFIFATAQVPQTEPAEWQASGWLTKPYAEGDVTALLRKAMSTNRPK